MKYFTRCPICKGEITADVVKLHIECKNCSIVVNTETDEIFTAKDKQKILVEEELEKPEEKSEAAEEAEPKNDRSNI
tara:strand:- start:10021 stop:10251 length:231 start_codon:yes stop_codon:yes gene_type:complete